MLFDTNMSSVLSFSSHFRWGDNVFMIFNRKEISPPHLSFATSHQCPCLGCKRFKTAIRQCYSMASLTSTACFFVFIGPFPIPSPQHRRVCRTIPGSVMCWIHCKNRATGSVWEMLVWHIICRETVFCVVRFNRVSLSPSLICVAWHAAPPCPHTPSSLSFLSVWGRLEESDHTECWQCPGTWSGWGRTVTGTYCPQRETAEGGHIVYISVWSMHLKMENITCWYWH